MRMSLYTVHESYVYVSVYDIWMHMFVCVHWFIQFITFMFEHSMQRRCHLVIPYWTTKLHTAMTNDLSWWSLSWLSAAMWQLQVRPRGGKWEAGCSGWGLKSHVRLNSRNNQKEHSSRFMQDLPKSFLRCRMPGPMTEKLKNAWKTESFLLWFPCSL